ncbi:DnaJ protein, putative [Plasmodium ovale]|uniref:DnaJ protein, putative n=1 Tax=Plasmodium ovale TaxID=36330 RepID=A0A1C3KT29_PLAOA|nr:DnaJ protein, putative [Plasmodium ovale]
MRIFVVTLLFLYFVLVNSANCLFKNVLSRFYCNSENCYSILGVGENATVNDIRMSYYRQIENIKEKYNPEKKKKIIKAYKILINKQTRKYYDYYLKNPNSIINIINLIFYCIYKLLKIIIILMLIIFIFCLFKYIYIKYNIKINIKKYSKKKLFKKYVQDRILKEHPNYRSYDLNTKRKVEEDIEIKVFQEMELSDKKPTQSKNSGSGSSGGGSNGGSGSVTDLLIVQLLLLPKYILFYILWNIKWVVKYTILKEEYDDCDKMYITRKCMNIPLKKWNILREDEKKMLMKKKLWIKENQEEFFEEIKEKQRLHKISSAKYKKQMRMKKKGFSFNYND